MTQLRLNNATYDINKIIDNGYTVRAGSVSGNSIEILESGVSITYYEKVEMRDNDLEIIKKAIADGKK